MLSSPRSRLSRSGVAPDAPPALPISSRLRLRANHATDQRARKRARARHTYTHTESERERERRRGAERAGGSENGGADSCRKDKLGSRRWLPSQRQPPQRSPRQHAGGGPSAAAHTQHLPCPLPVATGTVWQPVLLQPCGWHAAQLLKLRATWTCALAGQSTSPRSCGSAGSVSNC